MRWVARLPERPGCFVWVGNFVAGWNGKPRPRVFRGQETMLADRAMWLALGRPGLVGRNYLRTTCGHFDCIAPEHLYLTNQIAERNRDEGRFFNIQRV